jgi:hypothetical protein
MHDHAARRRSYELIAREYGPEIMGLATRAEAA